MSISSYCLAGRRLVALGLFWFLSVGEATALLAEPADSPTVVQPGDDKPSDDNGPPPNKGPVVVEEPSTEGEPSADEKLVREVWGRLIAALDVPRPEGYDVWPPVLDPIVESDEINAYANFRKDENDKVVPYVVILNGWVKEVAQGNADRLAFVLGHELGHHVHNHVLKYNEGEGTLTQRVFQSAEEKEADMFGIQLALKAGYSKSGVIDSWKRFIELGLDYSSFEGKSTDHPSWTQRLERMDQGDHTPLWESMIAFRNGVFLLQVEQYALAERCFREVTKQFPDCHEGWANLGFAQLMMYCDALEIDDLRKYNLGQLALGAFYQRPASLEARVRGVDDELWFSAVGALRQALILKNDLVIPKVNLGLAYMLSPTGPQVGRAEQFFEAALAQANQPDAVDPTTRMAVLINAAVADLAAGRLQQSSDRLTAAAQLGAAPSRGYELPPPHFLQMATQYNRALILAATNGEQGRKDAADMLVRNYLTQADPTSAWWTLAYEQYEKLCGELKIEPKPKQELQRKRSAGWRLVTSVTLASGQAIDLLQTPDDIVSLLGEATRTPVLAGIRLERIGYPDLGIDLLATSELLAIRVSKPDAASIELRGSGLGTERQVVKIGMDKAAFEKLVQQFPAQGLSVKKTLRLDGLDAIYQWYPSLGLAVLVRDNQVQELVVVPLTRV